jgi:hypothetical protein
MTQKRRFTKKFEDEAVRLVRTSGRSQREIAEDLGIGWSTLVRWIGRSRDRWMDAPDRSGREDVAAELKRLRRENEILHRPVRPPRGRLGHGGPAASGAGAGGPAQGPHHAPSGTRADPSCGRGSQCCPADYQAELQKHRILISMSGKGNCYDNAMVETFFKTLKSELIWHTMFETRQDAEQAIGRYIDGFYNPVRRHSALDFTSPAQFEKMTAN